MDFPPPDSASPDSRLPAGATMHLLFRVRGALFGIEAALAREIHPLPRLAPLAEAAPWVAGVLDLRGEFVPVLDLARRLGHAPRAPRLSDCLLVLEQGGQRLGLVVDEVLDVRAIAPEQQEDVPRAGSASGPDTSFVRALAHIGEIGEHTGDRVGESGSAMLLHAERLLRFDSGPKYLEAPEVSGEAPREAGGLFTFGASEEDRAAFDERARRLAQRGGAEEREGRSPFAIVGLGGEQFGIGLEGVREFCSIRSPTPVPCCPAHIVGQMNLRGDILTLLDIRHLLHLPPANPARRAEEAGEVVVIESGGLLSGVLVDSVLDVLYLRASAVASTPGKHGKYFSGGALHGGRMLGLLDLPRILSEGGLVVDETV